MNRRRWTRTRRRLERQRVARITEMFMRDVSKTAQRELFFGERGPEQFAAGGALADHPGPDLATLPKGTLIVPNRIASA